jgi:xanthine dehydrogenase iron-sulfur cluster and FAD-binding subunit A
MKTQRCNDQNKYPHAKIVNGNTEVGIETRFKNQKYWVQVHCSDIQDLQKFILSDNGFEIGGCTTWSKLQETLSDLYKNVDVHLIFVTVCYCHVALTLYLYRSPDNEELKPFWII